MSKHPPTAPTANAIGPCPSIIEISKMDGCMTCDFTSFLHVIVFQSYQDDVWMIMKGCVQWKSRWENPQRLTQLSSRSNPRYLVGKRTAQKDIIIDIKKDSQVNNNFPYRWSPASLTFNNYFTYSVYG